MKNKLILLLYIVILLMCAGCSQDKVFSQEKVYPQEKISSKDIIYTKKSFSNEELKKVKINPAKKVLYQNTIDDIKQTFYYDNNFVSSYIKVGNTDYFLGKTIYNKDETFENIPLKLVKADLNNNYAIYKFVEVIGANYANTKYLTLENQIPKIIMTIDENTFEKDIDNDKKMETISQYGSPGVQTTLYKWDFKNRNILSVNLNETIFKGSPSVYINDKSQIAAYVDGKEKYYIIRDGKISEIKQ